ncbi:MAG: hypothetical protein ACK50D_06140 [Burkholderiales bacterium]
MLSTYSRLTLDSLFNLRILLVLAFGNDYEQYDGDNYNQSNPDKRQPHSVLLAIDAAYFACERV